MFYVELVFVSLILYWRVWTSLDEAAEHETSLGKYNKGSVVGCQKESPLGCLYLGNTDAMVSIDQLWVGLQHPADFRDLDKISVYLQSE